MLETKEKNRKTQKETESFNSKRRTMRRKKRRKKGVGLALPRVAEAEEVVEEEGVAESVTLWKYIIISEFFFISLKIFVYSTNSSSTVCFSFSAHIIKASMS